MKLSKITIQNFRGFQEELIELDDITVFVGENNTGKSSVLDAIRLVIGSQDWNEKLTRYDYHLSSATSHAGDAGDILLRVEISESKEDEWPDEIQQTLPESIDIDEVGLRHFFLSLKGTYNKKDEKSLDIKEFQNKGSISKGIKANTAKNYSDFRKLLPAFYITSLRDSTKEFQQKKGLFKRFLESEIISPEKRGPLETKLASINTEIIDVLENIKRLKENLKKSMVVLTGTDEAIVDIEPLPTDLNELIGKAGIILQNKTGVRLPLERHGSGSQSLSVLFLYEAFLSVLLATEYDKYSEPVLLIEEPEAHLHPSAIRLFWKFLEKMPGQKIITTHSGDIISSVPFSKIRRIVGTTGRQRIKAMSDVSLDEKEKRFLRNYITYSRGELFFAKCWLIVEGETEQAFFENLLNSDGFLDQKGIRIIQFTQIGLDVLYKLADQLRIRWFLVIDGDPAGQVYKESSIKALPAWGMEPDYIYAIQEKTIEVNLMLNGFSAIYENYLSQSNRTTLISLKLIGNSYFEKLYELLNDQKRASKVSKPQVVLEIVEAINNGSTPPPMLNEIRVKLEAI
ncbi:MAG: DUF2813 domain-containing protein [Chlorobium sp.]|nr:DUF2813 domain-containing protein [Chlorobium sp.]